MPNFRLLGSIKKKYPKVVDTLKRLVPLVLKINYYNSSTTCYKLLQSTNFALVSYLYSIIFPLVKEYSKGIIFILFLNRLN